MGILFIQLDENFSQVFPEATSSPLLQNGKLVLLVEESLQFNVVS